MKCMKIPHLKLSGLPEERNECENARNDPQSSAKAEDTLAVLVEEFQSHILTPAASTRNLWFMILRFYSLIWLILQGTFSAE